ncbi:hypothetical protein FUA23_15020 [Neolewinella aurantiaca]|uniref:Uncharacterized protein n=1 Tax=Neolewinella aurantiaca TaxID=2602767 RepID=A0A5C7FPD3_9BACT|nr:hypothetical protein [Neolewinella aurantiaca]TXF88289.1 hypothetical protein FUA23_15020 [Neolewinella aurantiaca]
MEFQLKPILSEIKELYSKPASPERFKEYISKLQGGTKGDLALPISGFNPMAKSHVLEKITELEQLDAEGLMEEVIAEFNESIKSETWPSSGPFSVSAHRNGAGKQPVKSGLRRSKDEVFIVVLNLADDLKGGWTNHYSTDFDSKFKLNALVSRNFCAPYFWTSESYSKATIRKRTREYLSRTLYRLNNPQPKTLTEHLVQEVFVAGRAGEAHKSCNEAGVSGTEAFYLKNKDSDEYGKIFNFFYGDEGAASLGLRTYGIGKCDGYDYAKLVSRRT